MMLPDWIVFIASWCVVIGGLAILGLVVALLVWAAVAGTLALRSWHFRHRTNEAARFLLWAHDRCARG